MLPKPKNLLQGRLWRSTKTRKYLSRPPLLPTVSKTSSCSFSSENVHTLHTVRKGSLKMLLLKMYPETTAVPLSSESIRHLTQVCACPASHWDRQRRFTYKTGMPISAIFFQLHLERLYSMPLSPAENQSCGCSKRSTM